MLKSNGTRAINIENPLENCRSLGVIGPPEQQVIEKLRDLYKIPDMSLRQRAIWAVEYVSTGRKVEQWVETLRSGAPEARAAATAALLQHKLIATGPLIDFFEKGSTEERIVAADLLARIGPIAFRFLDTINKYNSDNDPQLRKALKNARRQITLPNKEYVDLLVLFISSDDATFRKIALEAVEAFGPEAATAVDIVFERIKKLVTDGNEYEATQHIEVLRKIGPEALGRILELSCSRNAQVRRGAAKALGEIQVKGSKTVPWLIALLDFKTFPLQSTQSDKNISEIRKEIIKSLIKIGPTSEDLSLAFVLHALNRIRRVLRSLPFSDLDQLALLYRVAVYSDGTAQPFSSSPLGSVR